MGDNKILSQNKIKIFDLFKINYFNILFYFLYIIKCLEKILKQIILFLLILYKFKR